MKNRITAGLLAIFLGGFGIHQFYLGRSDYGILSIIFFWTGIPALIGLYQGIVMLTQSDEDFRQHWNLDEVADTTGGAFGSSSKSKAEELKRYYDLYKDGAITEEEYEQKKKDLL